MAAGFQKCRNVTPAPPGRGSVRSRFDPNWSRIAKRRIPRYAGGRAVRPAEARLSRLGLADGLWRVGGAPQAQAQPAGRPATRDDRTDVCRCRISGISVGFYSGPDRDTLLRSAGEDTYPTSIEDIEALI